MGAVCGKLERQRRAARHSAREGIAVIAIDDKTAIGLAGWAIPELPNGSLVHGVVVTNSRVRSAAEPHVTNIRPFTRRIAIKIEEPSVRIIVQVHVLTKVPILAVV